MLEAMDRGVKNPDALVNLILRIRRALDVGAVRTALPASERIEVTHRVVLPVLNARTRRRLPTNEAISDGEYQLDLRADEYATTECACKKSGEETAPLAIDRELVADEVAEECFTGDYEGIDELQTEDEAVEECFTGDYEGVDELEAEDEAIEERLGRRQAEDDTNGALADS